MDKYLPFKVEFVKGAAHGSPEQMYRITADFEAPSLSNYKLLFDKYGLSEGIISLIDVTALIIESNLPDLFDHLDFDEESYQLDIHADSEAALQDLALVVCSAFRAIEELERYVQRVANK